MYRFRTFDARVHCSVTGVATYGPSQDETNFSVPRPNR
ncbi:hypothetical protein HDF09_001782 [Edaphobacter lichenicola]|uniref:Uncharacterized protein n=1 Tax=Tunturiibacter empetritectus TaxID=3069691 RepID=A0A7W8MR03_9BACT|nr:hypothetical protein [Edaphobacter lichenicola]